MRLPADWGVVGQHAAVAFLSRSLTAGRARQSYLFVGPPQVGKARLASAFAQALNCEAEWPPCLVCRSCQKIARGKHPDVHVVSLAVDDKSEAGRLKKNISIAQIQEIQHELSLQPYEGKSRVVIVDGAELMTTEAANALLKTLEEPPDRSAVILVTTDPALLLPTVVSRCQRVELRSVAEAEMVRALVTQWNAEPTKAMLMARLSGGRIGWAVRALESPELLDERAERLDALDHLFREELNERLDRAAKLASRFTASREEVYEVLELWQGWLRDVMFAGAGRLDLVANIDREDATQRWAIALEPRQVRHAIQLLRECRVHLQQNVNPRLAIEHALASLPKAA